MEPLHVHFIGPSSLPNPPCSLTCIQTDSNDLGGATARKEGEEAVVAGGVAGGDDDHKGTMSAIALETNMVGSRHNLTSSQFT